MKPKEIKELLDKELKKRQRDDELSYERPDPLMVATRYKDERVALICALFAYGNAKQIVKFLDSLDFSLLEANEKRIKEELNSKYYRFQNSNDVSALFIALRRLSQESSIEEIVKRGYKKQESILDGLWELIQSLRDIYNYDSRGYRFLIGQIPKNIDSCSPFKRYMMYFRWMVREDKLDLGLWSGIKKSNLIIPLDTHTHKVSLKLGLISRKSYDLKSAINLTNALKEFDNLDPIKYDFALYRIGQEGLI